MPSKTEVHIFDEFFYIWLAWVLLQNILFAIKNVVFIENYYSAYL